MWIFTFESIVSNSIFIYAVLLLLVFLVYTLISSVELGRYTRRNSFVNYKELLVSPHAPPVSVISPVNNLESEVIDHVRALFALQYNNFDIIVVNDGSTDNTLQNLKEFYQLETVDFAVYEQIKTQPVHAYYKSANTAFSRLTVVDKAPGGKADALNAGLNTTASELVLCIEMDSFLDKNIILKLVKPFLEESRRVILAGTAVHIANSCDRRKGHLVKNNFPRRLLPAFQAIEYFKSFLVERLTWSRLNGIHIISGAVGLFDKEILIESGGYSVKTSKEGFELIVRMCRYMHDSGLEYRIVYIPEPLCWVQAPASLAGLGQQRKAWAKSNFQTFRIHKDLFFNKKYGFLGWINFPYWFFFEWITPFFKLGFAVVVSILAFTGKMNLEYLTILLLMIYFLAVSLSAISVLFEEKSYRPYSSLKDVLRILVLIFIEPVLYHPLTIYWKLAAYIGVKR